MMELVVARAVVAVVTMIGWSWLFLHLFLLRVTAEIDAVRDNLVAKLDARWLSGGKRQLEAQLESRRQRLEDRQSNLRLELARLEGILIGRGRLGHRWLADLASQPVMTADRCVSGQAAR